MAAARRLGARLVAAYGKPLERPDGPLTHCFPAAETLAAADPAALPMPRSRARALTGLAAALASGELSLDPGAERDRAEALAAGAARRSARGPPPTSGCGRCPTRTRSCPRTSGVLDGLARLGAVSGGTAAAARTRAARAAAELAENWRPWRSYAVHYLWAYLEEEKDRS